MTLTRPPRRSARLALGALAGLALAVAVPLAASAHVEVSPSDAAAGATSRLTFSFSHGCDGSPTTALVVDVPEGVGNVKPVVDGAWTIARDLRTDGTPSRVTFTADAPIESGLAASVSMDVLVDSSATGTELAFPVTQQCVVGATAWTEIAPAGTDPETLAHPAPVVAIGAVAATDVHDHAAATEPAATSSSDDTVARALGIGGLALGAVGLAVGVVGIVAAARRRP